MNAQDLFGTGVDKPASEIALSQSFLADPYAGLLGNRGFRVRRNDGEELIRLLEKGQTAAAFISVPDYARLKMPGWRVLPHTAFHCREQAPWALLYFGSAENSLEHIVFREEPLLFRSYLELILRERYEITPHWEDGEKEGLSLFYGGLPALEQAARDAAYWDITDQWYDLTETPLVSHFWIVREEAEESLIRELELLRSRPLKHSQARASGFFANILKTDFTDEAREGLAGFYDLAFAYAMIEFMPEIKFYGEDEPEEDGGAKK